MTPEAWTIIGTGVAILIAIATSHRSLRAEFRAELRRELGRELGGLRRELEKLRERIDQVQASLTARMNSLEIELRERLARVEGVLGVVRDAVIGRGPEEPVARRPSAGSQ